MFNKPNPTEYWRLLAHESTHIMQACLGTNLYGSYQIKDMSYELMDQDENSYRTSFTFIHSKFESEHIHVVRPNIPFIKIKRRWLPSWTK